MAVMRPIWRTVWPTKVVDPQNADEERIALLQLKRRSEWTGDDWRVWAEFLEWRGRLLADELNTLRTMACDLAAKVPVTKRRGPKPSPKPMTLAAGLLGLVRVPMPRTKGQAGRPVNQLDAEDMKRLLVRVETIQRAQGIGREAALRQCVKADHPRLRAGQVRTEARRLSRKFSRMKSAR